METCVPADRAGLKALAQMGALRSTTTAGVAIRQAAGTALQGTSLAAETKNAGMSAGAAD